MIRAKVKLRMKFSDLSHAYIVSGELLADTLAMAAVCLGDGECPCRVCAHCVKASRDIHPDIAVVAKIPPGREIVVDQIRALQKDVYVVPNEAERKVYIIDCAETMNTAAQNALLRILEEPPRHVVFILKTENSAALLPTVRSRCLKLNAPPETDGADPEARQLADEFFAALTSGNVQLTEFSFRLDKLDRAELSAFIAASRNLAAERFRDGALSGEALTCVDRALTQASEYLDMNVSAGHIAGLLCASLIMS